MIKIYDRMIKTKGDLLVISNGHSLANYRILNELESENEVSKLLILLANNPLCVRCYRYGFFEERTYQPLGRTLDTISEWYDQPYFTGNFANLSHVFTFIVKKNSRFEKRLRKAIQDNLNSDQFKQLIKGK